MHSIMPSAAARPCRHPGCGALVRDVAYCQAHLRVKQAADKAALQQYEKTRGSSSQRGYGARWQKMREPYLRSHPLCKTCEDAGKLVVAVVIDHKIPHKGDMVLFWDRDNWQPLCKTCHDAKTAREDGGWGRAPGGAEKSGLPRR